MIGHIDHGKSTLIGRLLLNTNSLPDGRLDEIKKISRENNKATELSFLVDQLKEERLQNRTIETTQINFKTERRNYVLIDVPGHAEFIKNMLTGASMADAAVLIIDAHQGIKEQTRRHAYLIKLLGIQKVMVVLNKMDLTHYKKERFETLKAELLEFFKKLGLTFSFIIPVSAKEDQNITCRSKRMRWYKGPAFLQALDRIKTVRETRKKPLRFCIQDVFRVNKENLAMGKVLSGNIRTGQDVTVMPSGKRTRVSFIKVFNRSKKSAQAGENIGIKLHDPSAIARGQIITGANNQLLPVYNFKASVFWICRKTLRLNKPFFLRFAAQEVKCTAERIEKRINSVTLKALKGSTGKLMKNEAAIVVFRTRGPLVIENFSFIEELGRFVIEHKNSLCGVGIVNDPKLKYNTRITKIFRK